mmetsp:Transcript_29652/g.60175  ORF Transcript_29652/g.60175 Transcript_29652/m.60175 type:complete len:151 (-) Transcript_29652:231-683(-)
MDNSYDASREAIKRVVEETQNNQNAREDLVQNILTLVGQRDEAIEDKADIVQAHSKLQMERDQLSSELSVLQGRMTEMKLANANALRQRDSAVESANAAARDLQNHLSKANQEIGSLRAKLDASEKEANHQRERATKKQRGKKRGRGKGK